MTDLLPAHSPLAMLKRARELLSDKKRWTQKAMARTSDGRACSVSDPNAECFCLASALLRSSTMLDSDGKTIHHNFITEKERIENFSEACRDFVIASRRLSAVFNNDIALPATRINDSSSHGAVLKIIDDAIDLRLHKIAGNE